MAETTESKVNERYEDFIAVVEPHFSETGEALPYKKYKEMMENGEKEPYAYQTYRSKVVSFLEEKGVKATSQNSKGKTKSKSVKKRAKIKKEEPVQESYQTSLFYKEICHMDVSEEEKHGVLKFIKAMNDIGKLNNVNIVEGEDRIIVIE